MVVFLRKDNQGTDCELSGLARSRVYSLSAKSIRAAG
jgi:hypothetical protein